MTEIRRTFHEELTHLQQELVSMGELASEMLDNALEALQTHDGALAASVVAQDARLDSLDADVERRCLWLIASQQPNTRDLRFLSAAFRMTSDLERVGDHAVDIAKITRKLASHARVDPEILSLAAKSREQWRQSTSLLETYDEAAATAVINAEAVIDDAFRTTRERLLDSAPSADAPGPAGNSSGYFLLALVSLERISHHAVHIAERLHFVETGQLQIPREV